MPVPEPSTPILPHARRLRRVRWQIGFHLLVLMLITGSLFAAWSRQDHEALGIRIPTTSRTSVLVLEDRDPDFQKPTAGDALRQIRDNGTWEPIAAGFNLCETVGAQRTFNASPDGRLLLVSEIMRGRLIALRRDSGSRVWQLDGGFHAAVASSTGTVFALTSKETIYGDDLVVISTNGTVLHQQPGGAFDLALDEARGVLWLVGKVVKRLDSRLHAETVFHGVGWCAVSVDVTPEGSVWVAERQHPNVNNSTNRILQLSPEGKVLRIVPLVISPSCVRVHPGDGSVWVTGSEAYPSVPERALQCVERFTGGLPLGPSIRAFLTRPILIERTLRFDRSGTVQCQIPRGGFSLAVDPEDGSVWIAERRRLSHYSQDGQLLGQFASESTTSQKYVLTLPPLDSGLIDPSPSLR